MIAKYNIDPDGNYLAASLSLLTLPGDLSGKHGLESETKVKVESVFNYRR